jgi:hypothetical protein
MREDEARYLLHLLRGDREQIIARLQFYKDHSDDPRYAGVAVDWVRRLSHCDILIAEVESAAAEMEWALDR